jgi:hypothetical protein
MPVNAANAGGKGQEGLAALSQNEMDGFAVEQFAL